MRLQLRMQMICGGYEEDTFENAGDRSKLQWRMQTICGGFNEDTLESVEDTRGLQWRRQTICGGCDEDTFVRREWYVGEKEIYIGMQSQDY
jgi:hypothetical protein